MTTTTPTWPLQSAKDRFSQLVKAAADRPQMVTVHGKPAAIVLSPQAYARLAAKRSGTLSAELLQPGLVEAGEALFDRDDDRETRREADL